MKKSKKDNIVRLIFSIAMCELAGVVGSFFTVSSIPTWYAALQKPSFSPPNWLFGPAWTVLYFLMGISFYLVWQKNLKKKKAMKAVWIFEIQLFLNIMWSFLFFGLKNPLYGFVGIVALWAAIAITIFKFYNISKTAAYLLVPYILWVSFALVLNYYVLILNV